MEKEKKQEDICEGEHNYQETAITRKNDQGEKYEVTALFCTKCGKVIIPN